METDQHDDTSYTPLDSQQTTAHGSTKSGGNQLTTALIAIIVVLLFVMLMLSMNGQLFQSGDQNTSDVTALESSNAQLRADANAERARQGLSPLPKDSRDARMMADRIQRDSTSLAELTGQWQTELETKDTALQTLQSELQSRDENAKRLYAQIASLTSKLDQAAGASDQLLSLGNNLQIANNQIENYRKQLAELQGRPSNEQLTLMRKQLAESIDSNGKLQMKIDGLLEASKNKIDRKP